MTAWPLVQPSLSVDHTQCGASFVVMVGPRGQSIATPPPFKLVRTLGRCILIEGIRGTDSATDIPQHCHQCAAHKSPTRWMASCCFTDKNGVETSALPRDFPKQSSCVYTPNFVAPVNTEDSSEE